MSNQENKLPPITHPDKQGPLVGLLSSLLSSGMDLLGAMHPLSYNHGLRAGHRDSGAQPVRMAKPRTVEKETVVGLKITDSRDAEFRRPATDNYLFDEERLVISPECKQRFVQDAQRLLAEDHQPTKEQWRAILSNTLATCAVGIAGTGKTYVMAMRVIFLNKYLEVPLEEITVLCLTKDCRLDVIALVTDLFAQWGTFLSDEQGAELVKTPRGALLNQVRELFDMEQTQPFDLFTESAIDDVDGRPFDMRLTNKQIAVLNEAYQHAYLKNPEFGAAVRRLYRSSSLLPLLEPDDPVVQKRAAQAWQQVSIDLELTEKMSSIWEAAGVWPLPGIKAEISPVTIRHKEFFYNGYVPELDAFVVLGFDRSEKKTQTRNPDVQLELYKECAIKRTMLQAYSPKPIIYLESYEQARALSTAVEFLSHKAPAFSCTLKGEPRPQPIAEALYHIGTLMETLGLNLPKSIGTMNFMPDDPDCDFFHALAMFWPAFESYLLAMQPASFTFNRLFLMFGIEGQENMKALPESALRGMRHVLIDEVQDLTDPIAGWMKACLLENRRRNLRAAARGEHRMSCTLFVAGDDFQTAHGSQGASPRYLLDYEAQFRCAESTKVLLGANFRSHQGIINAAHSMVMGIPAVNGMAPVSVGEAGRAAQEPVMVHHLDPALLTNLIDHHYDLGEDILILAANQEDFKAMEPFLANVLERDKGNEKRRVRVRACQRSKGLEAEAVFIIGDFTAPLSSWSKNQIYRMANGQANNDQSPFDTIQLHELYRLAHIGITRARRHCHWLIRPEAAGEPTQMRASIRIKADSHYLVDKRT